MLTGNISKQWNLINVGNLLSVGLLGLRVDFSTSTIYCLKILTAFLVSCWWCRFLEDIIVDSVYYKHC